MNASTTETVYIVDDDPAARESVAALVSSKGVPVKTYENGLHFLRDFEPGRPGAIVLDVKLGEINGIEVFHELRRRGAANPVIVITGFGDIPTAVQAMRAGAATFLEKPCKNHELWDHIRAALDSESRVSEEHRLHQQWASMLSTLNDDEWSVLHLLLDGNPNKKIATELDLGLRTIELRRASIMSKMQAESLAHLVRKVVAAQRVLASD